MLGSFATEVTNEVKENRFSRGKVCPHCGHDEVSGNGKYHGKQKYICKSCRKTFTDFTLSPKHTSKKDIKQWIQYTKCMINVYSIRKCAKEVKISIPTSFYWRHKILDSIRAFMGIGSVGGVIEVDELSLWSLLKTTLRKAVPLLCHESPIIEALKAVLVVRPKREKGVYPWNRSVL